MEGRASAPAAGTILNALATGIGGAFAIDRETTATVELTDGGDVTGEIVDVPGADTGLIERCVERVVEQYGDGQGAQVKTESAVPMAAGLKSSSAAANAVVLATLDALDCEISREDALEIGVRAARDVGITITGCAAGAHASMFGGAVVADNTRNELLGSGDAAWDVLVWMPAERAFSADANVERCKRVAPLAELVADLALDGAYERAMTVNGFAFCAALDFPTDPLLDALPHADGVSLSGSGSSYTAVGERNKLEKVQEAWNDYEGDTWLTTTRTDGARMG
jgi:shikimate kinase